MADTEISWTEKVWNATTGCDQVAPGCTNCYAMAMAKRLKGMGSAKYQNDGDPRTSGPGFLATEHPSVLTAPLSWRKPTKVFVNSMSDLFHDRISDEFIARVFAVMAATPQHTYQLLTKRHARMRSLLRSFLTDRLVSNQSWDMGLGFVDDSAWPLPNVHVGVSVEDQQWAGIRIPALLDTPAAVRWISAEPLLGPVDLRAAWMPGKPGPHTVDDMVGMLRWPDDVGINWMVVGGESGPGARPMEVAWARSIVEQCQSAGVPVHVKQMGSVWARDLTVGGEPWSKTDPKGGDQRYWPADLRVREYPEVTS